MNKKKITKRIILLSALCMMLLLVFSSCNNSVIVGGDNDRWADIFATESGNKNDANVEESVENNAPETPGDNVDGSESDEADTSANDTEGAYVETTESVESTESTEATETESAESSETATSETATSETESTEAVEDEALFFGVAEPVRYLSARNAETDTTETNAPANEETAETEEETTDPFTPNGKPKQEVKVDEDFGFLDTILAGIGTALRFITNIIPGNPYIITLLIFAIVMEVLFLPFGIKQHKNSIKQAMLKPKEVAIRRRYAGRNDQATMQKLNQEIQELYQKENYNPMSGCLPMLIQLPVLIVIYGIVVNPMRYVLGLSNDFMTFMYHYLNYNKVDGVSQSPIELLDAIRRLGADSELFTVESLGEWCSNPAAVKHELDFIFNNQLNLDLGFINLGKTPSYEFWNFAGDPMFWALILVPILTFVVYFFSMRLNRKLSFQPTQNADEKQQACSNTMMDIMMPLMSVWIAFKVPAAIGVYWMFKSILGVVKQFALVKAMPLPKFTEDDYKAAEKELAGKRPKKVEKSANAGKVRSLHHIDDEDYDEQGNYRPVQKEEAVETTAEETNNSKMSEGASMKDESDKQQKKFSFRDLFKKNEKKEEAEENENSETDSNEEK